MFQCNINKGQKKKSKNNLNKKNTRKSPKGNNFIRSHINENFSNQETKTLPFFFYFAD